MAGGEPDAPGSALSPAHGFQSTGAWHLLVSTQPAASATRTMHARRTT